MEEKLSKTWDELIEKLILDYQKWWKQKDKERWYKLLFRALKSKYENRTKEADLSF